MGETCAPRLCGVAIEDAAGPPWGGRGLAPERPANVCRDMLRKRRNTTPLDEARLSIPTISEEELGRAQQLKFVEEALRTLPEKERAAVTLRDIEGLSTREVAEILGSSEVTVRSQVSAARTKIRKILRRRT